MYGGRGRGHYAPYSPHFGAQGHGGAFGGMHGAYMGAGNAYVGGAGVQRKPTQRRTIDSTSGVIKYLEVGVGLMEGGGAGRGYLSKGAQSTTRWAPSSTWRWAEGADLDHPLMGIRSTTYLSVRGGAVSRETSSNIPLQAGVRAGGGFFRAGRGAGGAAEGCRETLDPKGGRAF